MNLRIQRTHERRTTTATSNNKNNKKQQQHNQQEEDRRNIYKNWTANCQVSSEWKRTREKSEQHSIGDQPNQTKTEKKRSKNHASSPI